MKGLHSTKDMYYFFIGCISASIYDSLRKSSVRKSEDSIRQLKYVIDHPKFLTQLELDYLNDELQKQVVFRKNHSWTCLHPPKLDWEKIPIDKAVRNYY